MDCRSLRIVTSTKAIRVDENSGCLFQNAAQFPSGDKIVPRAESLQTALLFAQQRVETNGHFLSFLLNRMNFPILAASTSLISVVILSISPPASAQIQDPRDLSGCVAWLDGADVDGDFLEGGSFTNGTTWVDKSTAANADGSQATPSARPTVVPDGLNERTTVLFDGNDFMDLASASFGMLNSVEGCTLFGLAKSTVQPTRGGQRVLMISSGANSAASRAGLNMFDSFGDSLGGSGDLGLAGRRLDSDGFQRIEGGEVTLGEFVQWTGVFDYANQTLSLYVEGTRVTQVTNFQSPGATSATDSLNIRIGADAALNSVRGTFTGEMAELIAYNRTLSDTERLEVESYLSSKWFPAPPPLALSFAFQPDPTNRSVTLFASGPLGDYILTSTSDLAHWTMERQEFTISASEGVEIEFPVNEPKKFFRIESVPTSP